MKVHGRGALTELFHASGFREVRSHTTSLSFSKDLNPACETLLKNTALKNTTRSTQGIYGVQVTGDKVHLRYDILNAVFSRSP